MTERSHAVPNLQARLEEIDRRLREIQAELVPDREPELRRARAVETPPPPKEHPPAQSPRAHAPSEEAPSEHPPPAERGRPGPLAAALQGAPRGGGAQHAQLGTVSAMYARLLAATRELLDGYTAVLGQAPTAVAPAPPTEVTVSVGPLGSISAMREFERSLLNLPGVRDVALRGFEGANRAILDVELAPEST